jgi:hypothetical protein
MADGPYIHKVPAARYMQQTRNADRATQAFVKKLESDEGFVYDAAEMCWKKTDARGRVYRLEF